MNSRIVPWPHTLPVCTENLIHVAEVKCESAWRLPPQSASKSWAPIGGSKAMPIHSLVGHSKWLDFRLGSLASFLARSLNVGLYADSGAKADVPISTRWARNGSANALHRELERLDPHGGVAK
jgi:hypothetical protein